MSGFSRQKGKRGERMLAAVLTEAGFPSWRGQQFHGGSDAPDIICPQLSRWQWEAKFVESARFRDWLCAASARCLCGPRSRRHGFDDLGGILRRGEQFQSAPRDSSRGDMPTISLQVASSKFQSAPRDSSRGDQGNTVRTPADISFQSAPRDCSRGD